MLTPDLDMCKVTITMQQWCGIVLIVGGIFATTIPNPIVVTGNFMMGLGCSLIGSLFLAASYPFSELIFKTGESEPDGSISEEMACCAGSFINSVLFTVWTLIYTVPRWEESVTSYAKPGEGGYMLIGYIMYGCMVALHSLSFWFSINKLGTVPTAVAKGAQQAGVFVFSHVIYCHLDKNEVYFMLSTLTHADCRLCVRLCN